MEVIPAIDLRGGKCVRLFQGDYARETVFSPDPVAVARRWEEAGAPRLHLVDLDGAALGEPQNIGVIQQIVKALKIPVQLGGGIRTLETVEKVLRLGVARVILGTVALENPSLVEEACRRFSRSVVVGVDARDGLVAVRGWKQSSQVTAIDLIQQMTLLGVSRFIYTDISRDGTLTEPNFEAIAELVKAVTVPIIASGGISSVDHLQRLSRLGVEGAIIGKALYTGMVDLREAIALLKSKKSVYM